MFQIGFHLQLIFVFLENWGNETDNHSIIYIK